MENKRFKVAVIAWLLLLANWVPAVAQRPHPDPLQPSYSSSNYPETFLFQFQETPIAYLRVPAGRNYVIQAKGSLANNDGDAQSADCQLVAGSGNNSFPPVVLDWTHIRLGSSGDADRQAVALQGSLCAGTADSSSDANIFLFCSTYNGKVKEAVITATVVPAIAVTGSSQPSPSGAVGSCIQQNLHGLLPAMVSTGVSPQSQNGNPDRYHSTVNVFGTGFRPGDTLQIVFRNLPDVVPDVCMVCSALYSHLDDVPAPTLAQVGADGTFQVAEVVPHNVEGGASSGPVTILVESTGSTPGVVRAIGSADASLWIGPMPSDF